MPNFKARPIHQVSSVSLEYRQLETLLVHFLLRRGKEGLGPIAFWTIRVKAEVALQVRYDRGGVVLGVVDLGQKKISFGKIRLPEERLLRATLRFRGTNSAQIASSPGRLSPAQNPDQAHGPSE
jgi:hypothetical protein